MDYENEILRVQWVWGNRCNYDCAYCPAHLHNNQFPIPDHDQFLEAATYLGILIRAESKIPCYEFVGGEPSQLPFIASYLKAGQGNMPPSHNLVTNGSASLEWFESILPFYKYIEISYHPGWANYYHIKSVLDFIREQPEPPDVTVVVNVDNDDERWLKGVSAYNRFISEGYPASLKLLYSDFGKSNQLFPYKTYQLEQYYQTIGQTFDPEPTVYRQEGIIEARQRHDIDKQTLENTSFNFKNKKCNVGLEQLVVMHTGDVYRSYCKAGGSLGNVFEKNVELPSEPITCPFDNCRNGFDREAKKLS